MFPALSLSLPLARCFLLPSSGPQYRPGGGIELSGFPSFAPQTRPVASDRTEDLKVLNFALSLENLVSAFLSVGLGRFSEDDFLNAGYPRSARDLYAGILVNERAHIHSLLSIVQPSEVRVIGTCDYGFPIDTVEDFVDLSEAIAALAVSTYTGMISTLTTKAYVSLLSGILAVEGRHSAWISSSLRSGSPWNGPFETPTTFNHTWSIARVYVSSCPPGNDPEAVLPPNLLNFPILEITSHVEAGQRISIHFTDDLYVQGLPLFAAFLIGNRNALVPVEVDSNGDRWLNIPQDLTAMGAVWILIVQDFTQGGLLPVTDANTVAGPALVYFPTNSADNRSVRQNAWSW
ncbi:hypothetical protein FA13DRAFT_1787294 [Coprinellus micaceus]|uniref:Uncharacterized protein n=1 Tax=Coprinellus micaceus TaxID=71717 RepID=A0A4Y7TSW8_COPMI|nr:hypothetical protein FA13DRAFT_1787294 [Coprinellus micaceus]